MRAFRRLAAALLIGMLCAALPAAGSRACGYHGALGDSFSAQHLRSIEVALALREAIDKGQFEAPKSQPSFLAFARAIGTLDRLRDGLATYSQDEGTPDSLAVLLVEAGLWTRYQARDGRLVSEPHVAGPIAGDAVVVTAEPVLRALLDGRVTVDRAMAAGLLMVDGDATPTLARLRQATQALKSISRGPAANKRFD